MVKTRLKTRKEIIQIWSKQSNEMLNTFCCPNCRTLMIKNNQGHWICDNSYCNLKGIEYEHDAELTIGFGDCLDCGRVEMECNVERDSPGCVKNRVLTDFCPSNCQYLSITEEQQQKDFLKTGVKEEHKCKYTNEKLYHDQNHPALNVCDGCYYNKKDK